MAGNNSIQFFRGTSAKRESSTEKLLPGQPFFETDTGNLYVGKDGNTQLKNEIPVAGDYFYHLQKADYTGTAGFGSVTFRCNRDLKTIDDLNTFLADAGFQGNEEDGDYNSAALLYPCTGLGVMSESGLGYVTKMYVGMMHDTHSGDPDIAYIMQGLGDKFNDGVERLNRNWKLERIN